MNKLDLCLICGRKKEYPNKPLCFACNSKRKCKNCGKPIVNQPYEYKYCDECNLKLFHNKK